MAHRIAWRHGAQKQLRALELEMQQRISIVLERFADEEVRMLRLTGAFAGRFKLRVGDYRVIVVRDAAGDFIVMSVGHRRDVYR